MRKWCSVVAMGALLALPTWAQQKSSNAGDDAGAVNTSAETNAAAGNAASVAPASRNVFALPSSPRPKAAPFPAAASKSTEEAPGRLLPRYEIAAMYQYLNFNPGDPFNNFNNHGATGSFTYNANKWLGLTAEIGGYHFGSRDVTPSGTPGTTSGGLTSFLFGPRLNLRRFDHFVPFAEFLVGGIHGGPQVTGDNGQNTFALAAGGGVDMVLHKNLAWRVAELDYFNSNFSGQFLGATALERVSCCASVFRIRRRRPIIPRSRPAQPIQLPFTQVRATTLRFT